MEKIKIPKDMDDAKALGTVLSKYKDTYYTQVLVAYFATYVLYPLRTVIVVCIFDLTCVCLCDNCFFIVVCLDIFASLQTFAIPGSIFLSILSGYLYPFPLALFLVCLVSNKGQYEMRHRKQRLYNEQLCMEIVYRHS